MTDRQLFIVQVLYNAAGFVFSLFGFILILLGITGTITLDIQSEIISTKVIDASPGVVFAVLGFVILFVSRPPRRRKRTLVVSPDYSRRGVKIAMSVD